MVYISYGRWIVMSRYCPECKHNFSDGFDECVYCGSELVEGTIETEDIQTDTDKPIYKMSDAEILEKYSDYRKRIEEQTGHNMTDAEFLCGIKEARRDSLSHKADKYMRNIQEANAVNIPKCPTCQSTDIKKVSTMSKASSVALWGLFSQKVKKQWHCNNCGSEW